MAMENAVEELISTVVKRVVSIATQTTIKLVLKDHVTDPHDSSIHSASNLIVVYLAGNLSYVTCKEPLRCQMSTQLRNSLLGSSIASEFLEPVMQQVIDEKLDLGCASIEKAEMEECHMVEDVKPIITIQILFLIVEWQFHLQRGELDYLVIDMPPGTGDIQLTLCQVVPLTAAVIVTTPQKLAFIDVAKGVRMFSKLKVPCVAVVENMCHFDADGKRFYPFGRGSGSQVVEQFGIPNLFDLPIRPTLSASGDSGMPEVVADPQGEVSEIFQNLGVCVVQQCAKIRQQVSTAVMYDKSIKAIKVKVPDSNDEFLLHPATVRRNDRSAQSVDEWTGEQKLQFGDIPEDIEPEEIRPMGNYAVSITWPDGFSQIAPYDQLQSMERLVDVPQPILA